MKSGLYLLGAILVVLLVWLVPSYMAVSGHVSTMQTALHSAAQYYKSAGEAHGRGLYEATGGLEPDATSAQKLIAAFGAAGSASSTHDQLKAVDALQKQLGEFFSAETRHVDGLSTNADYVALNQEITGRGGASSLVFEYNKAAAVVREDMASFPGSLFGSMLLGQEPPMLFLDGKTRDVKVML